MGRNSKLTEKQWEEIGKRLLEGDSARALGREYGISESSIRERFSAQHKQIKAVANQIVATESALKALPISAQISAHNLADRLKAISEHLTGAANYGAATAHRLSAIAHAQVEKVDDAEPQESEQALKNIAVLTKTANLSSEIAINLLRANKETIDTMNREPLVPEIPDSEKAAKLSKIMAAAQERRKIVQ